MRLLALVLLASATITLSLLSMRGHSREPLPRLGDSGTPPGVDLPTPGGVRADRPALPAHGFNAWQNSAIPTNDLGAIRRSGAPLYRFNMITTFVDWNGDGRATRKYDRLVREATLRDITLLPVLMRLRTIKRPAPPRTAAEHARWRAHVGFFASRYGAEGSFWRETPELPYRPIRIWEIWNEPNLRQYWGGRRPDPVEYRRVLAEGRTALRSADPGARVLSAGIAWRHDGGRYLASVLAGGGSCLLDAVSIHPYGDSVSESVGYVEEARAVLDGGGAQDAQLWPTEIGWRVAARGRYTVPTDAAQGRALSDFAAVAARRRAALKLGPTIAFALRDRADRRGGRAGHSYGLLRGDGTPRAAWRAWSQVAAGAGELSVPPQRRCGR